MLFPIVSCAVIPQLDKPVPKELVAELQGYIRLSGIAACDLDQIQTKSCYTCNETVFSSLSNVVAGNESAWNTQWYTAIDKSAKNIIVTFRGTDNVRNWLMDLDAFAMDVIPFKWANGAKVHNGWDAAVKVSLKTIGSQVQSLLDSYSDFDIVFVGHSAGAALAALHAMYASQEGGYMFQKVSTSRISLRLIASPRIGDQVFADLIDSLGFKSIYRLTNSGDVVPQLPPKFMGYRHFSQEVYMNNLPVPNANPVPVFCDNSTDTTKEEGSCNNRPSWPILLLDAIGSDRVGNSHLDYMNVKIGRMFSCFKQLLEAA